MYVLFYVLNWVVAFSLSVVSCGGMVTKLSLSFFCFVYWFVVGDWYAHVVLWLAMVENWDCKLRAVHCRPTSLLDLSLCQFGVD